MAETDTPQEALTENDEACCGLLVSQVGHEWSYCPFCGGHFRGDIRRAIRALGGGA